MAFTATPQMTELSSGVDALYVSSVSPVPVELFERLGPARELAVERQAPVLLDLGGVELEVQQRSFNRYTYSLIHPYAQIGFTEKSSLPPVYVQFRAAAIHALGVEECMAWLTTMLKAAGYEPVWQLSRIDLYMDVQGLDLTASDASRFVCRARKRDTHEDGNALTGYTFGRRNSKAITARIYDKVTKILADGSDWMFVEWGERYVPGMTVWRIEFEFHRKFLGEFGVVDVETAMDALGDLWSYGTEWLSMRDRTEDSNSSRWPVSTAWGFVRAASMTGASLGLTRVRQGQRFGSLRKVTPLTRGLVAQVGALTGASELVEALANLRLVLEADELQTGVPFALRLSHKSQRLGLV